MEVQMPRLLKMIVRLIFIMGAWASQAQAQVLRVETTLPDFKEMIEVIGGDQVQVRSLLQGTEDPHFLDAKPAYVSRLLNADLLVFNGLELEIGWLPKIVSRSGNTRIQEGASGACDLGAAITVKDKPTGALDRGMGHVHASGNPHFNLSPSRMSEAAVAAKDCLTRLRPEKATQFQQGLKSYQQKMRDLSQRIQGDLAPYKAALASGQVMEYHQNFVYFFDEFGIRSAGSVEEKPGVAPSAGRLAKLSDEIRQRRVQVILVPHTLSERGASKLNEFSGVRLLRFPTLVQVQGSDTSTELLLNHLAKALVADLAKPKTDSKP